MREWKKINSPIIEAYQFADEPEIVYFIRTGFENLYHVIEEDAYQLKPDGKDFLMTKEEILVKFGITLKI